MPADAVRCGIAAAVAMDAPVTLVANTRAPCFGVRVDQPDKRPDSRRVDEVVDTAEGFRRGADGRTHRRLVGHIAFDSDRVRPGLLGRILDAVTAPGEQSHLIAALRQP